MKKKVLLSIVALFLMCFSIFGFVGCDSAENPAKLVVEFENLTENNIITLPRAEIGNGTTPEMVEELKKEVFYIFGFKAKYYEDGQTGEGIVPTKTFTTYGSFLNSGGLITGFNLAQKESEKSYKMQIKYLDNEVEVEYKIRPKEDCQDSLIDAMAECWDNMIEKQAVKEGITNREAIEAVKDQNPFRQ